MQISQVKGYITRLLSDVSVTVGRHISAQDYVALLPTLWMLLNSNQENSHLENGSMEEGADALNALLDHGLGVSAVAAVKRPTVDFLVRLILVGFLSALSTAFGG